MITRQSMTKGETAGGGTDRQKRKLWVRPMLVLAVVLPSLPALAPPAPALPTRQYARITRDFNGVPLRTRGYYKNEACLVTEAPCHAGLIGLGRYRPEATAQAKVIRALSSARGGSPISDKVQWEVAPPKADCEADERGEGDPPDLPPGYTRCNWRIDVVVDDGTNAMSLLEVRRWQGQATQAAVNSTIERYRSQALAYNGALRFDRNGELNASQWVHAYVGGGAVWCVWADRDGLNGNIYFAKRGENATPDDIKEECDTEEDARIRQPGEEQVPLLFDFKKQDAEEGVAGKCMAAWAVTVLLNSTHPLTLALDYGDGSLTQTVSVPQGSGYKRFYFEHIFALTNREETYVQRATILETGASAEAVIHHGRNYATTNVHDPAPVAGSRWGYRMASANLPGPLGGAPVEAGDLDGDGLDDFFVGHPDQDRVHLMSGKAPFGVIRTFSSPEPLANEAAFGFSVSVLGDVTGDGQPDVAIDADGQQVGYNRRQGKAWVFNGATGAVLYALNHPIPQSNAAFGSLGRAGDVNGDTIADVIVGAPEDDVCVTQSCTDAVNNGHPKKTRNDSACGVRDRDGDGDADPLLAGCRIDQGRASIFSGANGVLIRTLDFPDPSEPLTGICETACGKFGLSVQGPGDVNADGTPDLLVDAGTHKANQGRMYLFNGATGGLLARIDDPVPQDGVLFGWQQSAPLSPGDVNGDGAPDLYGAAFVQDGPTGVPNAGRAWVFDGKATVAAGTGTVLYELRSPHESPGARFGFAMATTDFDNDTSPDLYVGSGGPAYTEEVTGSGGTYVYQGAELYRGRDAYVLRSFQLPFPDAQDSTAATNRGSELGWSLAAPGDLNEDGKPDYLAGAPYQDVGANTNQGMVAVFLSQFTPLPPADFNADLVTEHSVFRPSTGTWYIKDGATTPWGASGDIPVPADYDGDAKADIAVFRPSTGTWYIKDGATTPWGTSGDMPVPADYDGDGKAKIAVFRPSNGTWYVHGGSTVRWGTLGDIPVVADYTGDGRADMAVFRPSTGTWYVKNGATTQWGSSGDIPVPADYDGDRKSDVAVFRPSVGVWFLYNGAITAAWGVGGDIPVIGDYDGDSRSHIAVFRPSNGTWYLRENRSDTRWGAQGDIPLPLPAAIRQAFFP